MKGSNFLKLIGAIVIAELAGVIGGLFTAPAIAGWYAGIARPDFSPPNWVFGPVWTTLYLLMGVALWLVWKNESVDPKTRRSAIAVFFIQLALNSLWSIIFFGLHSIGGALVEIVVLWLAIVATIFLFRKISRPAAWLLAPYLLWVTFAAYLNYSLWMLN